MESNYHLGKPTSTHIPADDHYNFDDRVPYFSTRIYQVIFLAWSAVSQIPCDHAFDIYFAGGISGLVGRSKIRHLGFLAAKFEGVASNLVG